MAVARELYKPTWAMWCSSAATVGAFASVLYVRFLENFFYYFGLILYWLSSIWSSLRCFPLFPFWRFARFPALRLGGADALKVQADDATTMGLRYIIEGRR